MRLPLRNSPCLLKKVRQARGSTLLAAGVCETLRVSQQMCFRLARP